MQASFTDLKTGNELLQETIFEHIGTKSA
jgi:hypothetical protein